MRLCPCIAAVTACAAVAGAATASAGPAAGAATAAADPNCTGAYGGASAGASRALRMGIDPGLAGSAGGAQLPATPDNQARDLEAVQTLGVPGRQLVVRLNRLFWSDGQAGIDAFKREVSRYTRAGFQAEIQVRYHPPSGHAGDIAGWVAYVRHVVDSFGSNPQVISMTITNEVNINFSPNTSDGYYARAEDALIAGIEAAHAEAIRRHFPQLRFGFTYAYRFPDDTSFFSYLGAHGGPSFQRALGFVGLDFYPGSVYPPAMAPGDSYRAELAQAAGVLRDCLAPQASIASKVPIWITENGVPTGSNSETAQAAALVQLVRAASAYARTFDITDYRWFNLRDSTSSGPSTLVGPTFASDGLLRDDYTAKPAFAAYRGLIAQLGTGVRSPARPRAHRTTRVRCRRRAGARRSCARSTAPKRRSSRHRRHRSARPDTR